MPACHGFKRRALGVVVVVDVHAWMGRSPITDVLDELSDSISFLDLVMRPKRIELPVAACVAGDPPKQEEEVGVGAPERVAFEIEEDVSIIGLRQCLEPVSSLIGDPEDLEWRELIGTFAGLPAAGLGSIVAAGGAAHRPTPCALKVQPACGCRPLPTRRGPFCGYQRRTPAARRQTASHVFSNFRTCSDHTPGVPIRPGVHCGGQRGAETLPQGRTSS